MKLQLRKWVKNPLYFAAVGILFIIQIDKRVFEMKSGRVCFLRSPGVAIERKINISGPRFTTLSALNAIACTWNTVRLQVLINLFARFDEFVRKFIYREPAQQNSLSPWSMKLNLKYKLKSLYPLPSQRTSALSRLEWMTWLCARPELLN